MCIRDSNIPMKEDGYSDMRSEYVEMLEGQIAKSNNGIVRTKLLTFGVSADSLTAARPRLERVEADISSNFKKLGVQSVSYTNLKTGCGALWNPCRSERDVCLPVP